MNTWARIHVVIAFSASSHSHFYINTNLVCRFVYKGFYNTNYNNNNCNLDCTSSNKYVYSAIGILNMILINSF